MRKNIVERFIEYIKIDTTPNSAVTVSPTSHCQMKFAEFLVEELKEIGVKDAVVDEFGYVTATLESNSRKKIPVIGLLAHMDTAPNYKGAGINPKIVKNYDGGDILLNEEFPEILNYIGEDLITTDGTTLLGADDKAGIVEIMEAIAYLLEHPELEHGKVKIAFTPDEEIGRGAELLNIKRFGADFGFTVDGGLVGGIDYENFNAANCKIFITGRDIHTGSAKGKLINSMTLANEFDRMLSDFERPEYTERIEGFYHLASIKGDVEKTEMTYLLRDHSRDKFEFKKKILLESGSYLEKKYSGAKVDIEIRDMYFNMKEVVEPYMNIIDVAKNSMLEMGITPKITPIRGGTDGARLSFRGLPCPNLFTGGIFAHGKYECISVQALETTAKYISKLIIDICDRCGEYQILEIDKLKIDDYLEDIVKSISEIVKINSVKSEAKPGMPFGEGPTAALQKGLDIAKSLGFKVTNLDNMVGYAEIGEGQEIVGILGHVDVVPQGDFTKWNVDPYGGVVKDGYIWGRGVSDNKGPVITALYAIKALLDNGLRPKKRIRVIMGADEESGFGCMKRYLETEECVTVGFTPDATFPGIHGEKGILQVNLTKNMNRGKEDLNLLSIKGGNAVNSVPDSCVATMKISLEFEKIENIKKIVEKYIFENKINGEISLNNDKIMVAILGKAAHGAEPEKGTNAISHMMGLLQKIQIKSEIVDFYNKYIALETDGKSLNVCVNDDYGTLSLNVGIIQYEGEEAVIKLDIRYPITVAGDTIIEKIKSIAKMEEINFKVVAHKKSIYFDLDKPFIKVLKEAYTSVTSDYDSELITIGGGTYARAMENIIAFGGCFMDQPEFAHQPNERVKIENIYRQGNIYMKAIYNLLNL